jgi:hypothetical protein
MNENFAQFPGDIDLDGLLKLFEQHGFPLMLKGFLSAHFSSHSLRSDAQVSESEQRN